MQYLKEYVHAIAEQGNVKLAESIEKTADELGDKYIKSFSFTNHEIGLLFGNIQSGKTGQMFGVMCRAADLGFPVFVILTTDNVILQQQTIDRVRTDLKGFCICDENDGALFAENSLIAPTIIVLKKNVRVLKLWANILNSTGFMKGNPLFVIDDEADAASLNTKINQGKQSSINKYLDSIKNEASSSIYLQVTGTPQAMLLQSLASGWHPYFTYYFQPGEGYLGGDFFFPNNKEPECIKYLETICEPERTLVVRHLAVSGITFSSGGTVSNCLVHPSVRTVVHNKYKKLIINELKWCRDNINGDFVDLLRLEYDAITPQKYEKMSFDTVYNCVKSLLINDKCNILLMNGKNHVDSEQYSFGVNIIIGGNTLGRGVTFPALNTIYYTRTSKKPQADTMWQHSRMFGYDRDPGMMNVFMDEALYKLFSDINATNNAIISQVERGIEHIKLYYADRLNPTRGDIIDNKFISTISGGANYYPFDPDNDTIEDVDELLTPFDDKEPLYQVNLRLMIRILRHIKSAEDFDVEAFINVMEAMLAEKPAEQGILIVRRNRNVAKGTGALLAPNDWDLGNSVCDRVVLTMYKMTGEKGWKGRQLWIPNIKLPSGIVYYNAKDEE